MKSIFCQFIQVFNDFGRYISPTYYHDRCERSVQMRLYTMHKREFVLLLTLFFACFGLCAFIGLAGPEVTSVHKLNASSLKPKLNPAQMSTGPFVLKSPSVSLYSQQLSLVAKIVLQNGDDERFKKPFHVFIIISGISYKNEEVKILERNEKYNRTRELHCYGTVCEEFTVIHLGHLEFLRYIMKVQFYGLEKIEENYNVKDILFYFKSYNTSFTQFEIWFRIVFLILSFVTMCWFLYSLRHFYFLDWSIEQKWISLLLPLLLLYNDPFFPLSFLTNSWVPSAVDAMFQNTFLCGLLLFWLCVYHGIRQNERSFLNFYVPKCIIVGLLWITAFILVSLEKSNELKDPTYDYKVDIGHYVVYKVLFLTIGTFYILYLLTLVAQAFMELHSMPYFNLRLKFLTVFAAIVLLLRMTITVSRFGISSFQDSIILGLIAEYYSCAEFLSLYSLLNFYIMTMVYVYSPPKKAYLEKRIKDNPTLSMINDSDEEVIYGSDSENHPLNSLPRGQNKEESD